MIVLDLAVGDSVAVGESVFTLREKSGRRAKVAIDAPRDLRVERRPGTDTRVRNVEAIEAEGYLMTPAEQLAWIEAEHERRRLAGEFPSKGIAK